MRASTCAPCGGFRVSLRISSSPASRESMFGTVRMEIRARAESTIWFDEPRMGWDSKAITVREGRVQSLSYTEKARSPASPTPFSSPVARANSASSKGSRRMRAR